MTDFKCKICQKILKSKRTLRAHEERHAQDVPKQSAGPGRVYLHCDACKKKFLTQKGLDNHKATVHASNDVVESAASSETQSVDLVPPSVDASHQSPPTTVTEDASELLENIPDDDEIFNTSIPFDEKEPSYFEEDDEAQDALINLGVEGEPSSRIQPKSNQKKKKALIQCQSCKGTYHTIQSYVKHRETHALTDLYKKAPSAEDIKSKSEEIVPEVLKEIGKSRLTAGYASEIVQASNVLQEKLMSQEWLIIIEHIVSGLTRFFKSCDSYLTPSDLRAAYMSACTKYSVNKEERKELIELLQKLLDLSLVVSNIFFGIFVRVFSTHLLTYFIHFMLSDGEDVSNVPLSARFYISTQSTDTLDFKQVLHYIAGANVQSVLRTALRIRNPNCEWTRIIDCIKYCLISGDSAEAPDELLMQWTLDQDRGGLIKISAALLDFYVELGITINALEHMDGSLYQDEFITAVTNSGKLIRLWDNVVNGSLPSDESFKLLHALCSHFCCTWRKGIITRRLDELAAKGGTVGGNKHGKSGVAFRAALN